MEIVNLLQELISKTFEINRKGKYKTFLNFSGHVESVEAFYCKGEWNKNKEIMYFPTIYLDRKDSIEKLQKLLKDLEKLERGE